MTGSRSSGCQSCWQPSRIVFTVPAIATLRNYFPEQCKAIQERFREYSAAMVGQRHSDKIAEFRKIAYQLQEQGIELFVNPMLKRMSVPRSLDRRIACELLTEIEREILAHQKPPIKSSGTMTERSPFPDAVHAPTE